MRAAARLATGLNASWIALYVEPRRRGGSRPRARRAHRRGPAGSPNGWAAQIERLSGQDLAGEVLRFARRENITQIVVGRSAQVFWPGSCADP